MGNKQQEISEVEPIDDALFDVEPDAVQPEPTGVKYVGHADRRILHPDDFRSGGVEDQEHMVMWSKDNEFFVPASELTPAAILWLGTLTDFVVQE